MTPKATTLLRFVRPAPSFEVAPEVAAGVTPLVPLQGADAARARLRRSSPERWVPVYFGIVATPDPNGHKKWFVGQHASHWVWPTYERATRDMQQYRVQGRTLVLLQCWAPVRHGREEGVFEIGPPAHSDKYIRSLCWAIAIEDVPDSWARICDVRGVPSLEWRFHAKGMTQQIPLEQTLVPASRAPRYANEMDASTSTLSRAKEALAAYYTEQGILPTVQRLAELLGMASTSSAHYVVKRLRGEGYLGSSEHGKLTPGPAFQKAPGFPAIPQELLSLLPSGPGLQVLTVDETWKPDANTLIGDVFIVGPASETEQEPSSLLLLRRGKAHMLETAARSGWSIAGVVLGQYRNHGR